MSTPMAPMDAWSTADPTVCLACGRDACEDHLPRTVNGFADDELEDVVDVSRQGREIAERGIRYALDQVIPDYGMVGFLVAYAKVGKSTFDQAMAAHIAMGRPFLNQKTAPRRVLVLA